MARVAPAKVAVSAGPGAAPPPLAPRPRGSAFLSGGVSVWRVIDLLIALVAAGTLVGYVGRLWWPLENVGVLGLHLAALLGVGAAVLLARRRLRPGVTAAALAVLAAAPAVPLYVAAREPPPAAGAPRLRLLVANVHTANRQHQRVIDLIARERPDAALIVEVDDGWLASLDALRGQLPHRVAVPRVDNFGIALLTRAPLRSSRVHDFGAAAVPSLVAEVEAGGRTLTLVGTHTPPPVSGDYYRRRAEHVEALARFRHGLRGPVVVAGDLNMTERVPAFRRLLFASGLRDSRRGFGVQPTWPADLPLLRVALDHCLVSPEVTVVDRRVGPDVGSDHLPVIVDLALPARE